MFYKLDPKQYLGQPKGFGYVYDGQPWLVTRRQAEFMANECAKHIGAPVCLFKVGDGYAITRSKDKPNTLSIHTERGMICWQGQGGAWCYLAG